MTGVQVPAASRYGRLRLVMADEFRAARSSRLQQAKRRRTWKP